MPAKKRKTQQERFLCSVCSSERVSSQFPEITPTTKCSHLINVCTPCLRAHVDMEIKGQMFTGSVRCPECEEVMEKSDIEKVARKKTFAMFVELDRRRRAEAVPGWQWCLDPECSAGQVFSPVDPRGEDKSAMLDDKTASEMHHFHCDTCSKQFCLSCTTPWHEGKTCVQFEVEGDQTRQNNMKSTELIKGLCKNCPTCNSSTEKLGGCDHMQCVKCRGYWCWHCGRAIQRGLCPCREDELAALALRAEQEGIVVQGLVVVPPPPADIRLPNRNGRQREMWVDLEAMERQAAARRRLVQEALQLD